MDASFTSGPVIRDIGDTARWAAVYRARETERPNPLFEDPFARQLAGARGTEIAAAMPFSEKNEWGWTGWTFFEPFGWRPTVVSLPKTAAQLKRLSFPMRLMALLPESSGPQGSRPWQAVCLLERARHADQRGRTV